MLFTDLVDEDCIHLGGVGLLMVMARAKASNAVAFYRFQYTEYMLKHHPTEIRSILTLQKRHCKGVCFLHQFVWLDIGWNECQDGCAKSAGDLESDQNFQTDQGIWFRDMPTSFLFALFRLADCYGTIEARNLDAAFVLLGVSWQDRGGQFIAGVWLGRGPAIMLSHVFEDSFGSCLSLTKHDMREVSWEQHQMKIELTCYILLQRRFHWIQCTWCL